MSSSETYTPATLMLIARQIRQLSVAPFEGVRYVPGESLTEVLADVDGPAGTPYAGGVFRVKLTLGNDFPSAPPKGHFLTKIFHPNVSNTGDICVNTLKKDWKPEHTLAHVLQVVHCLLIVPFPESSLNDEAGKLFMESYDEYARKARLMTGIHASAGGGAAAATSGAGAGAATGAGAALALTADKTNVGEPTPAAGGGSAVEKRKAVAESADAAAKDAGKKKALKRL